MEKAQLFNKIEEIVNSSGFLLIELNVRGDNNLKIIEIFIDGESGINSEDCASVSRLINEAIETGSLLDKNYRLDVSSPGVERPLKYLAQFAKHTNRKFEITYKDNNEEIKITAKLIRVDGENLFFEEKKSEYKIHFGSITKAKVLISF